jgi:hypothetical protein
MENPLFWFTKHPGVSQAADFRDVAVHLERQGYRIRTVLRQLRDASFAKL